MSISVKEYCSKLLPTEKISGSRKTNKEEDVEIEDPVKANEGGGNASGNPLAFLGLKRVNGEDEDNTAEEHKPSDPDAEGK